MLTAKPPRTSPRALAKVYTSNPGESPHHPPGRQQSPCVSTSQLLAHPLPSSRHHVSPSNIADRISVAPRLFVVVRLLTATGAPVRVCGVQRRPAPPVLNLGAPGVLYPSPNVSCFSFFSLSSYLVHAERIHILIPSPPLPLSCVVPLLVHGPGIRLRRVPPRRARWWPGA